MDTHRKTEGTTADRRWLGFGHGSRTIAAVVGTVLICGAATAGAANLRSKSELNTTVQSALSIHVTGGLPTQGFKASGSGVKNTPDGVTFGPYANGGSDGGSICTTSMNGQPFGDVKHLAFMARYTADNNTGGVGVPYLRVFLGNQGAHDAIFSPNTQSPDPDVQQGPFHTWVATAGSWRYDDDPGNGADSPFKTIRQAHASMKIAKICISVGNTAGTNLSGLLLTWEVNTKDYSFGQ